MSNFAEDMNQVAKRQLEPAPRRKHSERRDGESYPDALSRLAGERDAALQDVKRLQWIEQRAASIEAGWNVLGYTRHDAELARFILAGDPS